MKNVLMTDIVLDADRFDTTVLPSLKYHAPYLNWNVSDVLIDVKKTESVVEGARASQVLSADTIAEIQRLPSFVQDRRFYNFANKIALARERNVFACLLEEVAAKEGADDAQTTMMRTHLIQIAVLSNHQNGRDTHIRQIKIFSPRNSRRQPRM